MVGSDTEFRFLSESAQRYVGLLAASLSETPRTDHRGSALNAHITLTAEGLHTKLAEIVGEYDTAVDETDRAEAVKAVRLLGSYARFMHRALPWLEDSIRSPLALGALYFVDEMAAALLGERPDVVPTRSDEYSTERWPFAQIFERLRLDVGDGVLPIILNLPALESRSFLLLPILGHELGHTAVWKADLVTQALHELRSTDDYQQRFEHARDQLAGETNVSNQRAGLVLNQRLEYWTEELLCDQVALQYLGPSYALAFSTYLVPLGWNEPGPRHPPTTVRVAHLMRWLEEVGWFSQLESRIPVTAAWLSSVAAANRAPGLGPALAFLLDVIDELAPSLAETVSQALGAKIYVPAAYVSQGQTISDLLSYEILPVQDPETMEAFDRRAIVYAGWLSIFAEIGDSPENLPKALAAVDSHDFFTKALEMSCLLAGWRTA